MSALLLRPDVLEMIHDKHWDALRDALKDFDPSDIAAIILGAPD